MSNKKMYLIIGAAALIILMVGAAAMAASTANDCIAPMDSQHRVMLDQLVQDQVISSEQAATIQSRMAETMSRHMNTMPEMMNNKRGGMPDDTGSCCGSQQVVAPE